MTKSLIAGIDIGGTKIALALATPDCEIVSRLTFPTEVATGAHNILERTLRRLEQLVEREQAELLKIGIGCAGPLDPKRGVVLSPPNLPGWDEFPIVETVRERMRVEVTFDNDANAAALAEHRFGAGCSFDNLVYVTISTGVGGGVIVGGQIVQGIGAGAGEIGHITVAGDEIECGCGGRGCLEAVASGTAIARRARETIAENPNSLINLKIENPNDITAEKVVEAARRGDSFAQEIWDETVRYLAIGIGNIIVTLAPEALIIGGGVSQAGEAMLFEPLRRLISRRVKILPVEQVKILAAGLKTDSGIYGALALARTALELERK